MSGNVLYTGGRGLKNVVGRYQSVLKATDFVKYTVLLHTSQQ